MSGNNQLCATTTGNNPFCCRIVTDVAGQERPVDAHEILACGQSGGGKYIINTEE